MWEPSPDHPLVRLFAGVTEQTFFGRLGVADPQIVDYLSGLLTRFAHRDEIYRLRNGKGQPLTDLALMLQEAGTLPDGGRTRREYYRHIGDVSLFWAGLFPETLQRSRETWGDHAVLNYTTCGKRSYWIASQYDGEQFSQEAPVLKRLSEQFELCATGLREVRREWEEAADGPHNGHLIQ
ncbi:hypothetical protein [Limnoglobus roseus]|uniref:Uncharacterized protein n=1 Tax=Limnoglobus roseus TaxID=2598579 RepID=A0A5C1AMT4_9BACT|nr:hypothetical protein [Limnoglobus roseus]QEL18218.1 hypothetical protein PX52LOC_05233 [Limnoglobus roseus]